jgi:hypothetical protein
MFANNEFVEAESGAGFVGATDSRLAPGSAFSAGNQSPQLLSSDGTDLGVDMDVLEMYTKAAIQGAEPMMERLKIAIDSGTSQAVIGFLQPSEASCSVRIYASHVRSAANLVADTNSSERQSAGRQGNITDAGNVQFLAGAIEPLSPDHTYTFHVDCGSIWAIGDFKTRKAGIPEDETDSVTESVAEGESGVVEYSQTADFANPLALPQVSAQDGKIRLKFPSSSSARYVRYRILSVQGTERKASRIRILPVRQ